MLKRLNWRPVCACACLLRSEFQVWNWNEWRLGYWPTLRFLLLKLKTVYWPVIFRCMLFEVIISVLFLFIFISCCIETKVCKYCATQLAGFMLILYWAEIKGIKHNCVYALFYSYTVYVTLLTGEFWNVV